MLSANFVIQQNLMNGRGFKRGVINALLLGNDLLFMLALDKLVLHCIKNNMQII